MEFFKRLKELKHYEESIHEKQVTIGQRIKNTRLEKNLTQEDVAKMVGVAIQTIYKYENGIVTNIPSDKIENIAKALETTPAYLMGWEQEPQTNTKLQNPIITTDVTTFPVIVDIGAGFDKIAVEDWAGDTVEIPNTYLHGRKKEDFIVLRVKGNSMYPLYHDGDKVLVLKQSTLNYSGEIGAILYNDESVTLKRIEYIPGENWLNMVPINPEYAPKHIEGEALEHCTVIGIPKLLIREI